MKLLNLTRTPESYLSNSGLSSQNSHIFTSLLIQNYFLQSDPIMAHPGSYAGEILTWKPDLYYN
jgi:hypothetical protein